MKVSPMILRGRVERGSDGAPSAERPMPAPAAVAAFVLVLLVRA
jgi:hypothetical protein